MERQEPEQAEAAHRKAMDQALRFLSVRDHSRQELYNKLCRKHEANQVLEVLDSLTEMGLLNEATFAANKAESLARKNKSRYVIRCELGRLGISADLVEQTLDELEYDEGAAAASIVRRQYTEKLQSGQEQKVMAALQRRGFSYGMSTDAIGKVKQEIEEEAQEI